MDHDLAVAQPLGIARGRIAAAQLRIDAVRTVATEALFWAWVALWVAELSWASRRRAVSSGSAA